MFSRPAVMLWTRQRCYKSNLSTFHFYHLASPCGGEPHGMYIFGIAIVWNPKGFVKDSMISVLKSSIFVIFDGSAFANKGKNHNSGKVASFIWSEDVRVCNGAAQI